MIKLYKYHILKLDIVENHNILNNRKFDTLILKNKDDLNKINNIKKDENDYWKNKTISLYLNGGCICIIVLIENEIANIRWIAPTMKAKKFVDPWPFKKLNKDEACWGEAYTLPKFRNMGVNYESVRETIKYLYKEKFKYGYLTVKCTNRFNLLTYEKFIYSRYLEGKRIIFFSRFNFYLNKKVDY